MNSRAIRAAHRPLSALLLALLLLTLAPQVHAQGPDEAPDEKPKGLTSLADLGFGDVRAQGIRPTLDFFFPGPGDFELGDNSKLTVDFSHSNLLLPDVSSMTVVLNTRPLRAVLLDGSNVDRGRVVIALPSDVIAKDFNVLSLQYSMALGVQCEDSNHPALFATVLPTTRLELDFASDPPVPRLEAPNLADYPYPFFRAAFPVVAPVKIVVPDDPSTAELTAAYRMAANLAAHVFFDRTLLNITQVSALSTSDRETHQLIVVGTPARQPLMRELLAKTSISEAGGTLQRDGESLGADGGAVAVVESPWNPLFRAMLITGASDEGVSRGVAALTGQESAALLAGPEVVLTEPIAEAAPSREFLSTFTLDQLGLGSSTIQGGAGTYSVTFSSPALEPGGTAEFDLVVSTPASLDGRRSNIVVELNGEAIQTISLSEPGSRRSSHRINLPTDLLRVGQNFVTFRASLYTGDPTFGPCIGPAAERLWLTIHSDSAIKLPEAGRISEGADLSSLPFPFTDLFGISETTFIVDPDRAASLRGGMLAAITFGRLLTAAHDLEVQPVRTATVESVGDRHVVAIGLPNDAPIRAELDRVLPLLFLADGSRAIVEEDETLTEVLGAVRLGSLQEARLPWSPDRIVLSIDGTDDTGLTWATEALTTRGFSGNVALLQSPTRVTTFDLERIEIEEFEAELIDRFTKEESRMKALAAFVLIAVGAVGLLAVWTFRDRLRLRS